MHLSMGPGEGRQGLPKQLVPICSAQKETLTRKGEGACEPGSWGLRDTRVGSWGMGWEQGWELPPGRGCRLALRGSPPTLSCPRSRKVRGVEQCSQAGQRGDLTSRGVQAAVDGEKWKMQCWGADTARGGVGISRNCLEETEEIIIRRKNPTHENIPQQYSAEIFFCPRVCHGESVGSAPAHGRQEPRLARILCTACFLPHSCVD